MMTMLCGWITMIVILTAINAQAACSWPAWDQFKTEYISLQGRVIDPGDARKIT
ncbi:glycosyl hydrolase family 8, partial [Salmonella enterica]|uniref:glycosyl hydrolase family 8 n=1 Tax=Salmonella enterica TaxID=28901 RepID=UPI001F30EDF8